VARRRVMAAVTMLAFVFAGVIGRDHEATTAHVRCEHGELVHGDHAATAQLVAAADDSVVRAPPASSSSNEHEHCLLAYASRAVTAEPRVISQAPITLTAADVTAAIRHAIDLHRDGLYRTAPKTSPPA